MTNDNGRLGLIGLGIIGGVAAFVGFFIDFFTTGGSSLASANVGWYDLIPVAVGLSTIALLVPKWGILVSGLPLGALGIALGIKGTIDGILNSLVQALVSISTRLGSPREGHAIASQLSLGLGAGAWLILLGSLLLAVVWVIFIVRLVQVAAQALSSATAPGDVGSAGVPPISPPGAWAPSSEPAAPAAPASPEPPSPSPEPPATTQ